MLNDTAVPTTTRGRYASWFSKTKPFIAPVISGLFIIVFAVSLLTISQARHSLSIVDEHIHFDTAARATHGEIPWRGALLGQELIDEWACGVNHQAGAMPYPCGDPRLTAQAIPSGQYTTGYIHYPIYFFGAAGFQKAWASVTGNEYLLDGFRAYSAVTLLLGVIACGVMAWLLRLRGPALIAATTLPVATSLLVFSGTIVNPTSLSTLTGALIGGTGLLWMQRGRGFVWFALAVAFGSLMAVTSSLPAGGFLIAMFVVMVARRAKWVGELSWRPRWWQLVVTAGIVLLPVVIWGRVIGAMATVPNSTLYAFAAPAGRKEVIIGAVRELSALHTPWIENAGIRQVPKSFIAQLANSFSRGIPLWITVTIFGAIVLLALLELQRWRSSRSATLDLADPASRAGEASTAQYGLMALVGGATVATVALYPPALRIANWLNFGFDFAIVDRYSLAFAPLLVFLLLLLLRVRWLPTALAVIGVVSGLGVVAAGWG